MHLYLYLQRFLTVFALIVVKDSNLVFNWRYNIWKISFIFFITFTVDRINNGTIPNKQIGNSLFTCTHKKKIAKIFSNKTISEYISCEYLDWTYIYNIFKLPRNADRWSAVWLLLSILFTSIPLWINISATFILPAIKKQLKRFLNETSDSHRNKEQHKMMIKLIEPFTEKYERRYRCGSEQNEIFYDNEVYEWNSNEVNLAHLAMSPTILLLCAAFEISM